MPKSLTFFHGYTVATAFYSMAISVFLGVMLMWSGDFLPFAFGIVRSPKVIYLGFVLLIVGMMIFAVYTDEFAAATNNSGVRWATNACSYVGAAALAFGFLLHLGAGSPMWSGLARGLFAFAVVLGAMGAATAIAGRTRSRTR